MEKTKETAYILSEKLWKVMINLSWPSLVAMTLYGLNSVLDIWFVGHFVGEAAVAGVSVVYPVTLVALALGSMLGGGGGSVLSIALGAQDAEKQRRIFGNINTVTILVSLAFTALTLIFVPHLARRMGGTDESMPFAVEYLTIAAGGAVFWIYALAGNMIIRAEGRMKTAALIMGAGLAVNTLANYILMGPIGQGVAGAAWGTNIAMFVSTLVCWMYFGCGRATFTPRILAFHADKDTISSILKLGSPALIMQIMTVLQGAFVFNTLAKIGTTGDIAFFGVVYRLFMFLTTIIGGLMKALQPVCGINFGAKKYERVIGAYKIYTLTAILLSLPCWLLTMAAPQSVLGLVLPNQSFTPEQMTYCRIYMAALPLVSLVFMAMTLFPAIGKSAPAAFLGIARQGVLYIPLVLLLPRLFGVGAVYYGSLAVDVLLVSISAILVKREFAALRKA